MSAFLGVLIWIGIIIVCILAIRSIILTILDKRNAKKKQSDNKNFEESEDNTNV